MICNGPMRPRVMNAAQSIGRDIPRSFFALRATQQLADWWLTAYQNLKSKKTRHSFRLGMNPGKTPTDSSFALRPVDRLASRK